MGLPLSKNPPRLASPKVVLALTAVVAVLGAVAGNAMHHSAAKPKYAAGLPAGALTVDAYDCGGGWTAAKPGKQNLLIANTGIETTEVYLIDPGTGAIYGELVGLAAGTSDQMPVVLGDGTYALKCWPADADPVTGPPVRVTGSASAAMAGAVTPGVLPVSRADLTGPVKQYQSYVENGLGQLKPLVQKLQADVAAGNLDAARADWVPAHQQYERLGGAYDAFGDVGDAIDGLPNDLPGGVGDSGFGGFHRLEYGLWHGQTAAQLTGPAGDLVASVDKLSTEFPGAQIDPLQLGLRTHEILEDAVRFELSGQSDQGSGTTLATIDANVDGTQALLGILRPILTPRDPDLPRIDAALARLRGLVEAQRHADGSWTPLAQLTNPQREALNSAAGAAVELLAPVATICEPRLDKS
ncbi:EfeM/EfeO family lipoprotein [Catenulispora sp. EB89]|uniref:EfeM/EfeO family lipoprotein n=1 Tax=Catenulispora sp. EB89 TaxID=3156257 RepID=UPI003511F95E